MASTKEIKRRIKSVKSTKKITKAMELVAASKMKRAISRTLASREYARYSWEVLSSLSQQAQESNHPLLKVNNNAEKSLIILVTSNRGLCGAYNSQVIKKVFAIIKENSHRQGLGESGIDFISVGKKGEVALRRLGQNIVASFNDISDTAGFTEALPIVNHAMELFKKGNYSSVSIAYTDFVSALSQVATVRPILPVSGAEVASFIQTIGEEKNKMKVEDLVVGVPIGTPTTKSVQYTFEPNYEILMSVLVEKLARMQFYQMLLESTASEHSSRMVAMKNASEAAGEMIDDLTLVFNKARQSSITQEISEISAGMASVS